VPTKKGNRLHLKGNKLPFSDVATRAPIDYARAIAEALRRDVTSSGASAKVIMRWTGASERAVKGWMTGRNCPTGEHLIGLMRNSDAVWQAVRRLVGRDHVGYGEAVQVLGYHLAEAERALAILRGEASPPNGQ
jgi:hypothetical protein